MSPVILLTLLAGWTGLGCAVSLPGAALGPPESRGQGVDRLAWIKRIEIKDPTLEKTDEVRDSLTIQLREFLQEGEFFREVRLLPGRPQPEDLTVEVEFKHFHQMRNVHPAYFPLALLTLNFYQLFGGPVFTDSSRLQGTMRIVDADGLVLAESSDQIVKRYHVSIWSSHYALPSGLKPRTQVVQNLGDAAIEQLKRREEYE